MSFDVVLLDAIEWMLQSHQVCHYLEAARMKQCDICTTILHIKTKIVRQPVWFSTK